MVTKTLLSGSGSFESGGHSPIYHSIGLGQRYIVCQYEQICWEIGCVSMNKICQEIGKLLAVVERFWGKMFKVAIV